jgi:hypothetical protein
MNAARSMSTLRAWIVRELERDSGYRIAIRAQSMVFPNGKKVTSGPDARGTVSKP